MDIAEKAWSQAEGLLTLFVLSCSSSRTRASASNIEAYLYIQFHIRCDTMDALFELYSIVYIYRPMEYAEIGT